MARADRNYAAERARGHEIAREQGYANNYQRREARRVAREYWEDRGYEPTQRDVQVISDFSYNYVPGSYGRDVEKDGNPSLRDLFFDWFPDATDDDFYDWLDDISGEPQ